MVYDPVCACDVRVLVLTFVVVVETQAELLSPAVPIGTVQLGSGEVVQLYFLDQEGARHGDSLRLFFSSGQTSKQSPPPPSVLSRVDPTKSKSAGSTPPPVPL